MSDYEEQDPSIVPFLSTSAPLEEAIQPPTHRSDLSGYQPFPSYHSSSGSMHAPTHSALHTPPPSAPHQQHQHQHQSDLLYEGAGGIADLTTEPQFYERLCCNYFSACILMIGFGLLIALGFVAFFWPLGLLIAALTPGVVILMLAQHLYKEQVTTGQMLMSFFECIMWMAPLLAWDMIWVFGIAPQLKDGGLCALCILAYAIQYYFFAGFCEELIKYFVIRRIINSTMVSDWRAMMVYGICAGCGFGCLENLLYVFSGGYVTGVVRAFASVPLHCTTGCIIGLALAKGKYVGFQQWYKVLFVPWFIHGTYDFLLAIGDGVGGSLGAIPIVFAFVVYILGIVYARFEAVKLSRLGPEKINIHTMITTGHPQLVLGQPGIAQFGKSTHYVCDCPFCCSCCCPSVALQTPYFQDHQHHPQQPVGIVPQQYGYAYPNHTHVQVQQQQPYYAPSYPQQQQQPPYVGTNEVVSTKPIEINIYQA